MRFEWSSRPIANWPKKNSNPGGARNWCLLEARRARKAPARTRLPALSGRRQAFGLVESRHSQDVGGSQASGNKLLHSARHLSFAGNSSTIDIIRGSPCI